MLYTGTSQHVYILSVMRADLLAVTISPAVKKTLSLGTELADTAR